jgi:hypothetical protein
LSFPSLAVSTALLEQDDKRRDAVRIRHRFVWKRAPNSSATVYSHPKLLGCESAGRP